MERRFLTRHFVAAKKHKSRKDIIRRKISFYRSSYSASKMTRDAMCFSSCASPMKPGLSSVRCQSNPPRDGPASYPGSFGPCGWAVPSTFVQKSHSFRRGRASDAQPRSFLRRVVDWRWRSACHPDDLATMAFTNFPLAASLHATIPLNI